MSGLRVYPFERCAEMIRGRFRDIHGCLQLHHNFTPNCASTVTTNQ